MNLYTIPGFENEMFGIIPPPSWADTSFKYWEARNPCLVFDTLRAILSKDTGSFKPIVKVPEAYRNFGQKTR